MLEILRRVERDAVEHLARRIVDHLQFDMLPLFPHELACPEVSDAAGAERRLGIAGPERVELAQKREKLRSDVAESDVSVYVEQRSELVRANIGIDILLETAGELRDVLLLERKPHRIGVAAEILKQVAGRFHCAVHVKPLHRAA